MIGLVLKAVGGLLIALGTMWALQGLGLLRWPENSVMLAQREWVIFGALAVINGMVLVWLAARRGR